MKLKLKYFFHHKISKYGWAGRQGNKRSSFETLIGDFKHEVNKMLTFSLGKSSNCRANGFPFFVTFAPKRLLGQVNNLHNIFKRVLFKIL